MTGREMAPRLDLWIAAPKADNHAWVCMVINASALIILPYQSSFDKCFFR